MRRYAIQTNEEFLLFVPLFDWSDTDAGVAVQHLQTQWWEVTELHNLNNRVRGTSSRRDLKLGETSK